MYIHIVLTATYVDIYFTPIYVGFQDIYTPGNCVKNITESYSNTDTLQRRQVVKGEKDKRIVLP